MLVLQPSAWTPGHPAAGDRVTRCLAGVRHSAESRALARAGAISHPAVPCPSRAHAAGCPSEPDTPQAGGGHQRDRAWQLPHSRGFLVFSKRRREVYLSTILVSKKLYNFGIIMDPIRLSHAAYPEQMMLQGSHKEVCCTEKQYPSMVMVVVAGRPSQPEPSRGTEGGAERGAWLGGASDNPGAQCRVTPRYRASCATAAAALLVPGGTARASQRWGRGAGAGALTPYAAGARRTRAGQR